MIGTGAIVGSYEILERLGTGGMGEVYRARHLHLDRRAAIKMLLVELSQDREAVDRFFAEAQATSLIHHPGIVEIFDCNVHASGRVYLVMELLEGETLAERLRRDPEVGRDLPLVLGIADQIADALGAAHARGIIHRDLKPENVFLLNSPASPGSGVPRVKVLDFGIAKLINSRSESGRASQVHTLADRVLGTPAYMSPEQCRDARFVDHRTDIYSLGCVLFEMIAGHLPFQANTFGELVAAQLWETPPALPPPASKLVARMLAKDPSWRLQNMVQVRSEIARVVRRARAQAAAGNLADLRRRWESFWNGRMASWLPPRARPVARWMGSLLASRRRLVGLGVGWVVLVSIVGVLALRERGAPAQQPSAVTANATAKGADHTPTSRRPPDVMRASHGPSAALVEGAPAALRTSDPSRPEEALPAPAPEAPPSAGSAARSLTSATVETERDGTAGTEDAEPAPRIAPRPRATTPKANSARATGARTPRPTPFPDPVELTDDQRKL